MRLVAFASLALSLALCLPACSEDPSSQGTTSSSSTSSTTSTGSTGSTGGAGGMGGTGGMGGMGGAGGMGGMGGMSSVPLDGFGAIMGNCGIIDAMEIQSPDPFVFNNSIDFGMQAFDYNLLSTGGKKVFDDGNLGGNSLYSEIFSYELLYRCELATLLKTEAEVLYTDTGGKKTDLLVTIDGYKVGVSVTRAFAYPPGSPYTVQQAYSLLSGKLDDILLSSANVAPADAWTKQILHVIAYDASHATSILDAYAQLPATTRADTLLLVSITDGDDAFIY